MKKFTGLVTVLLLTTQNVSINSKKYKRPMTFDCFSLSSKPPPLPVIECSIGRSPISVQFISERIDL